MRIIYVYEIGYDRYSFVPRGPGDEGIFAALCNQVGLRVHGSSILIPCAGDEAISPAGFIVAARCRLFRLRVWYDRAWPHPPDAPHAFRRHRRRGLFRPRAQVAGIGRAPKISKPRS
jgi:hypothetical protein